MGVYIGCDVGTVSVKAAVLVVGGTWEPSPTSNGDLVPLEVSEGNGTKVFLTPYRRIRGNPLDAVRDLLADLSVHLPEEELSGIALTGSGARLASERFGLPFHSEFKALAVGIGSLHPDVDAILEMGGENSKFLRIETHPEKNEIGIPGGTLLGLAKRAAHQHPPPKRTQGIMIHPWKKIALMRTPIQTCHDPFTRFEAHFTTHFLRNF